MTLPKQIRDNLGVQAPGRVTIQTDAKGRLTIARPVPLEDIHRILGKPDRRDPLTEREKLVAPQVLAKYEKKSR